MAEVSRLHESMRYSGTPGEIAAYKRGLTDACDVIAQVFRVTRIENREDALEVVRAIERMARDQPFGG